MTTPRLPKLRMFWDTVGRPGSVYFTAEALGKGGTYLLFIWLATQMTVDAFGFLNVFISLLTLLGVVVGFGLPDGVVRFHFRDGGFVPAVTAAMTFPWAGAAILVLMLMPWRGIFGDFLNVPGWLPILAAGGAALVAIRQSWLGLLRARRETGGYLMVRLLEPVLFLAFLVLLIILDFELDHRTTIAAYVAGLGLIAMLGVGRAFRRFGFEWDPPTLQPLARFSLPLVAHSFAMTGLALFDQVVLQQLAGAEGTGIYAFAYRFGMAMSLVALAFTAVWGPLALERLRDGKADQLVPLARLAFRALLGSAILFAWTLPWLAGFLGGARYAEATSLIPLVVYAYLWLGLYTLAAVYLVFRNRSASLALASASTFLLNAALNYLTIPVWGPLAAAVTTAVCYLLLALLVWGAIGRDRDALPWGSFAFQAVLASPLILAPALIVA